MQRTRTTNIKLMLLERFRVTFQSYQILSEDVTRNDNKVGLNTELAFRCTSRNTFNYV